MAKKKIFTKILLVHWGGIGDFLKTIPAIKAVRETFPFAHLTLMAPESGITLLKESNLINNAILFKTRMLSSDSCVIAETKHCLTDILQSENYDLILNFLSWELLKEVANRVGCQYIEYSNLKQLPLEAVERPLELVRLIGADTQDKIPKIILNDSERAYADRFWRQHRLENKYTVAVHPGSGHRLKRWDTERFATLCNELIHRYGVKILLFGGPNDKDALVEVTENMDCLPIIVEGIDLRKVASLIEKVNFFVGNDSGIMHLAAAVNKPTVGIFGPADPNNWGPSGSGHQIVYKGLECGPCTFEEIEACDNLQCVKQISVGDVLKAVDNLMGQLPTAILNWPLPYLEKANCQLDYVRSRK